MEHGREALVDQGFVAPQGGPGSVGAALRSGGAIGRGGAGLELGTVLFSVMPTRKRWKPPLRAAGFLRATIPAQKPRHLPIQRHLRRPRYGRCPRGRLWCPLNGGTPESYVGRIPRS